MTKTGKVYLVGAGPGDPLLITHRGLQVLAGADIVLYDYLVNPELLHHVPASAERICLGRHGRDSLWPAEKIHQRLVSEATEGRQVVRLKSGDPLVFGRAAGEIDCLRQAGIPFEIVPGITAAMAAASHAGIPLTDRRHASAVALITGQEMSEKDGTSLDFNLLAQFPGTLVIYMGVTTADKWTGQLIDAGMASDRPVALIRRCSWPQQQVIRCRLDEVTRHVTPYAKFPPPVIAVVGEVARELEGWNWFESRPLFGETVVVTRAAGQTEEMRQQLRELGANTLVQPAIEIVDPPDNWAAIDNSFLRLRAYEDVVFSSANGVRHFLRRLFDQGHDARVLAGKRIVSIGPGTTAALAEFHLKADLQPQRDYRAESLVADLCQGAHGRNVLLVKGSRGRDVLRNGLADAGANVTQVIAYESRDVEQLDPMVAETAHRAERVWITVTSSAIARAAVKLLNDSVGSQARWISISPLTSEALRELGVEPTAEADEATIDSVVATVTQQVEAARRHA